MSEWNVSHNTMKMEKLWCLERRRAMRRSLLMMTATMMMMIMMMLTIEMILIRNNWQLNLVNVFFPLISPLNSKGPSCQHPARSHYGLYQPVRIPKLLRKNKKSSKLATIYFHWKRTKTKKLEMFLFFITHNLNQVRSLKNTPREINKLIATLLQRWWPLV